ncbi:MAG: hypothetical protein JSV14_06590 [Deltaproteobacteria bacterium]|nr:MAG: hypothetical protein JSV14_06590 [Deltaproteobacteria bacterium]
MDLLQKIKSERAQSKKKRPFKRTLFDKVNCLVRTYGLEVSFLSRLEVPEDYLSEANVEFAQLRKKKPIEFPLFSLAAEREYRLATAIMNKVDNPYLEFAQSPEEIAISKTLFDLNPSLGADQLVRYHFETLLLCERAKKEMKDLAKQANDSQRRKGAGSARESLGDEGSLPDSLEQRIEQLQSFVEKVEDSQAQ